VSIDHSVSRCRRYEQASYLYISLPEALVCEAIKDGYLSTYKIYYAEPPVLIWCKAVDRNNPKVSLPIGVMPRNSPECTILEGG
jgi:hypothetical protein